MSTTWSWDLPLTYETMKNSCKAVTRDNIPITFSTLDTRDLKTSPALRHSALCSRRKRFYNRNIPKKSGGGGYCAFRHFNYLMQFALMSTNYHFPPLKNLHTPTWIGGWLDSRPGLKMLAKRKISFLPVVETWLSVPVTSPSLEWVTS